MSSSSDDERGMAEDASRYEKLELREHILKRPENYIGSIQPVTELMWVVEDGQMTRREVTYVPGLYKIFDEVLVNAADNAQRDPPTRTIKVDIDVARGYISVWNDGVGIPITQKYVEKEQTSYWIPEFIFGQLLTSSNFDDTMARTTGGRNGFGAKLANIYSTKFLVDLVSMDDNGEYRHYHQEFSDNMETLNPPVMKAISGKTPKPYTKITFYPDFEKFGMDGFTDDILGLLRRRVWDLSGVLKTVTVWLNNEKIPVRSWGEYCRLFLGDEPDIIQVDVNERWSVAIAPSRDAGFQQVSFVNSVATTRGGTHVELVTKQIVEHLRAALVKGTKKVAVKPAMVRQYLFVFVNSLINNPTFDSQTKETLTLKPSDFGSTCELPEAFLKKLMKTSIPELIREFAKFKEDSQMKKLGGRKTARVHIAKLTEANEAGKSKSAQCTLILTEGDSAKGMAVTGLSVIGHDFYGVFPLRGKLLNTRDVSAEKLKKNEEIQKLMQILALKPGMTFGPDGNASIKDLRYGGLMIMADQDQDGSHIKGLIINFIHSMWPTLFKHNGFLCEFITPIVKAFKGKDSKAFYTLPEFINWKKQNNDAKGWTVKYYKGLATSNEEETKEYFSRFEKHRIGFTYSGDQDNERIELAFSKKKADDRKMWLADLDPDTTYIGHDKKRITYSEFVDQELILFSNYANVRSIPSVVDGLKPGQRKILWVCLKTNLRHDIKVAQLSGKVSEQSAYHHGEQSLNLTIVGMAQAFVGSNNINVLVPSGNFGSRLLPEAGSARYIYTRLTPITRTIFHPDDDQLLDYLTDEGMPIEPKYYVPVIPMVLINGADGIGVGWSTKVPQFNPLDVIENCRRRIRGEPYEEMLPWYSGFTGEMVPAGTNKWMSKGLATVLSNEQIDITELPVQVWTDDYTEFIDRLSCEPEKEKSKDAKAKPKPPKPAKKKKDKSAGDTEAEDDSQPPAEREKDFGLKPGRKICDFKHYHTNDTVHFEIYVNEEQMDEINAVGLEQFFRLSRNINATNMTLFSPQGKIKQYRSPQEILDDFFEVRLQLYEERKNAILEDLRDISVRLSNQARFIKEFIEKKLELRAVPRVQILRTLKQRGYDLFESQKKLPKKVAEDAVVVDEEEDPELAKEKDVAIATLHRGYDYLLGMKLWTLTQERYEQLLRQRDEANENMERVSRLEPVEMWLTDLDKVEASYKEFEAERDAKRAGNVQDAANAKQKSKSKVKITKSKNPRKPTTEVKAAAGELRSDVDSQVDEMDPASEKKPARPPKTPPKPRQPRKPKAETKSVKAETKSVKAEAKGVKPEKPKHKPAPTEEKPKPKPKLPPPPDKPKVKPRVDAPVKPAPKKRKSAFIEDETESGGSYSDDESSSVSTIAQARVSRRPPPDQSKGAPPAQSQRKSIETESSYGDYSESDYTESD
jgi:DNA topoisomerase-2